jgi:two-component system, cell cycle response regulator CpdR
LRDSAGLWVNSGAESSNVGWRIGQLCQAASGLSICPVPHMVEDFRPSPLSRLQPPWPICPVISLLVYQISARFLRHRRLAVVLHCAGNSRPDLVVDPKAAMTAKPSRLPLKRILLAEDDESMRGFLERALTKAGYQVTSFANGKEAHERLQEEPFTLLLTDIVMPQMDGIELARRAAELDPQIKIMFITGFAAVTLNTNSRPPKDARVLSKPFHLKDLVREIDRLLAI